MLVKALSMVIARHPRLNRLLFHGLRGPYEIAYTSVRCAFLVSKTTASGESLLFPSVIADAQDKSPAELFQIIRAWIVAVNTEIIVTSRRVIYKTGFISRNTVEMNLDKVESVLVQQSILGRMLDFGTVIIRGVGAGLEPVDNIAAPLELHRHVSAPG